MRFSAGLFSRAIVFGLLLFPVAHAASFSAGAPMNTARQYHTMTPLNNGKILVAGGGGAGVLGSCELYDPAANTWTVVGSLATPREYHSATLLANGKVLVVGGQDSMAAYRTNAELFDPATNTWSGAGTLSIGTTFHTATLLNNGKVLVSGGQNFNGTATIYTNNAELYDPVANSWTTLSSTIPGGRGYHAATLLPNGKVLLTGGIGGVGLILKTTAIFDPTTNTWTAGSTTMSVAHWEHSSTLLPNGTVLIAGGLGSSSTAIATAEIYTPGTDTWASGGTLNTARAQHTAALLPNGTVLVIAGYNVSNNSIASAEIYNPTGNTWTTSPVNLATARYTHTSSILTSGRVFTAGGLNSTGPTVLFSTEIYDYSASVWTAGGSLATARQQHTSTLLPSGKVLVAGGSNGSGLLSSAEMYNPASNLWSAAGSLSTARQNHTATLLFSGKVLVTGGQNGGYLNSAELYDPASNSWSTAGILSTARIVSTATLLPSGKVLVSGGYNGSYVNSAEVYDPMSNSWSMAGNLSVARGFHTATMLTGGKVLVAGGFGNSGSLNSAEVYDPASNSWSSVGNLTNARYLHTATLLPSGKVLLAAGYNGTSLLSSAELYDPTNSSWISAGTLSAARENHTATLLFSGKVLVSGGNFNGGYLNSAELYDPASNTWNLAGSLSTSRAFHTAALLPSGNLLVAGGNNGGNLTSTELTDDGLQYLASYRPAITSATSPLFTSSALALTGTQLTGISGASSGSLNDSSSNGPVVQIRSLGNDQVFFLGADPANPWSATSFTSPSGTGTLALPAAFPPGYAMVTVFSNGIPSGAAITQILQPVSVAPSTLPNPQVGVAYIQTVSASGGLAPLTMSLINGVSPTGVTFNTSTGVFSGTPTAGGSFPFRIQAVDSSGAPGPYSASQLYNLIVAPPTLVVTPSMLPNGQVGVAYPQTISASGGTASYSFAVTLGALPAGLSLANNGQITGTPTAGGNFNVTITATDSSTGTGPYSQAQAYSFTIAAPTITFLPASLPNSQVGVSYSQQITASGGTSPYTYAITTGSLPAGLTMNTSGQITGTPTAGGVFNLTVKATDSSTGSGVGNGAYSATMNYSLQVNAAAVVVNPATLPNAQVGVADTQTVVATGGTPPYTYAISSGTLPTGLNFSTAGQFSGTPTQNGSFPLTIRAFDSSTGTGPYSGAQSYTLVVNGPTITLPTSLPDTKVAVGYNQSIVASGGTSPYTYAMTGGALPAGLNFANGQITGTPTAGGSFSLTVMATDSSTGGGPFTGTGTISLTVDPPTITLAPATLPDGQIAAAYNQTVTASGGIAPYSYAVTGGALPAGLMLDTGGHITGTPTATGNFSVTITATDSTTGAGPYMGNTTYMFAIDVSTISIAPALPNPQVGVAYDQMLSASGGTAPYTFSVPANSLPAGLSMDSSGHITGTPTAGGSFPITITATDSTTGTGPEMGTRQYTQAVADASVTFSPATLPNAQVGVPYDQFISAMGGTAPYTFYAQSPLPSGLSLSSSGELMGTPTAGANFAIIDFDAIDSSGGTGPFGGGSGYSLRIDAATILLSPSTLPAAQIGTPYNATISASGGTATYTYAVTSGALPAGLTLSTSGAITGTPTQGGTFSPTITAADSSTGAGPYSGSNAYSLTLAAVESTIAGADASIGLSAASQSVQLNATVSSIVAVNDGTVTFQVMQGQTIIGSAVTSAAVFDGSASVFYTLPAGTIGLFTIVANYNGSPSFEASSDSTHTLTVHGPQIASAAGAVPNPAGVGETVSFSVAATDAFGDTPSYSWDFGDSMSLAGPNVSHAYQTAGVYTATVTVSDGRGGIIASSVSVTVNAAIYGTGPDSDGDGYSDSFEIAAGSDPNNAASTPLGNGAPAPTPGVLSVKSLAIKLNFVKPNDTIALAGSVPVPKNFVFTGQTAVVQIGDYVKAFMLSSKGVSTPKGNSTLTIGKPNAKTGLATIALKVAKGSLAATFASAGLTPTAAPKTAVHLLVTVLFNAAGFQKTVDLIYTQTQGKSGSAK